MKITVDSILDEIKDEKIVTKIAYFKAKLKDQMSYLEERKQQVKRSEDELEQIKRDLTKYLKEVGK